MAKSGDAEVTVPQRDKQDRDETEMMHRAAWDVVSLGRTDSGVLCGRSWQEGSLWELKASWQDTPDSMSKAGSAPGKDSPFSNNGGTSPGQKQADESGWSCSPNG